MDEEGLAREPVCREKEGRRERRRERERERERERDYVCVCERERESPQTKAEVDMKPPPELSSSRFCRLRALVVSADVKATLKKKKRPLAYLSTENGMFLFAWKLPLHGLLRLTLAIAPTSSWRMQRTLQRQL